MSAWRLPLLVALIISSLLQIHLSTASANHQDTAILREPDAKLIFVEDEQVTTKVIFSTGNLAGNDHNLVYDNTTAYYLTITDRSEQGINMPPYNTRVDVPLMTKLIHNYSRPLPEGYWIATVEVRDGASPDGQLLDEEEHRFIVKGIEFSYIARQAVAEERNADITEDNLRSSPMIAGGAAVAGASATYFGSYLIERRREGRRTRETDEFHTGIRNLIRHDLNQYSQFLGQLLANSETVATGPGGFAHNRYINNKSAFWPELVFILQFNPDHYSRLTAETTARVFEPNALTRIDESYRRVRRFLSITDERVKLGDFTFLNYDNTEPQEIIDFINDTIELIE